MTPTSASWSWRRRFYAFLLRRALGPFLAPESAAALHRSIRAIDIAGGEFALADVELDPAYLTSLLLRGEEKDEEERSDDCYCSPGGSEEGDEQRRPAFRRRISRCGGRGCDGSPSD